MDFRDRIAAAVFTLRACRPRWRDRRFWVLQGLTLSLVALHVTVDFGRLGSPSDTLYFLPVSLLLVPMAFAALTYGLVGAIATALWIIALNIPDVLFGHQGPERVGVMAQLLLLSGIASIIGRQVDRERRLRHQAETAAVALKASTMKYQGLLGSNPVTVLVVSPGGAVLEANPAAAILFGKNKTTLEGMQLSDLLGAEGARRLLTHSRDGGQQLNALALTLGGREVFLEPGLTESDDGQGNPVMQVLLRDVTEEYQRRAGLRAYAAEVLRALEEERQLMARELHDETIQTLLFHCRQLDDLKEIAASSSPLLLARLKEARQGAENVVNGLRDFARALRPPVLDDLGITVSIRRLLSDFAERTRIEAQLIIAGQDRRLPSDIELGIFRITQEALRNVERHAGANYVAVITTFTERGLRLDVVDNGHGFSTPVPSGDLTASGKLGLISMQERAQLLGGKLEIQSNPGKGARLTVSVPDASDAAPISGHRLDL